jgi:hypothetical protein
MLSFAKLGDIVLHPLCCVRLFFRVAGLLAGHKFLLFSVGFLQIGFCFSKVCCIFSPTQCQIAFMVCMTPKSQHLL